MCPQVVPLFLGAYAHDNEPFGTLMVTCKKIQNSVTLQRVTGSSKTEDWARKTEKSIIPKDKHSQYVAAMMPEIFVRGGAGK